MNDSEMTNGHSMSPLNAFFHRQAHVMIVLLTIVLVTLLSHDFWKSYEYKAPFQFYADIKGYYSYLPALFIEDNLSFEGENFHGHWLVEGVDGRNVPRYTMGVAMLQTPFFLVGHASVLLSRKEATGYTAPYSTAIMFSSLFYVLFGFSLLLRCLANYFNKVVVTITGLLIFFATNLFHYTLSEGETSHSYLFFCLSAILFFTDRWWKLKKRTDLVFLSFFLGLGSLIRPTEALFSIVVLGWGVTDVKSFKERIQFFKNEIKQIWFAPLVFLIPILPQLIYWKFNTGIFFPDTYPGENFFFNRPEIINFLVGYRKGWMVYTPLMFLAVGGIFLLRKYARPLMWVLPIFLVVLVYVLSSWWCWWYGGTFGMRAMVEYTALMAFPLASLLAAIFRQQNLPYLVSPLLLFLVYLNLLMTYKHKNHTMHYDSMTKDAFWFTLMKKKFKPHHNDIYQKLLHPPDYQKARRGEDEGYH